LNVISKKIDHIEAQVDSYDLTEKQDLSMQISNLAQNDTIEAELATMKKKVVNS
jgi:phage shock protein A